MPNLIVTRGLGPNNKLSTRGYGGAILEAVRRIVGRGPSSLSRQQQSQQHRIPEPVTRESRNIDDFVSVFAEMIEKNSEVSSSIVKGDIKVALHEISSNVRVISEHMSTRINRALSDIVIYVKRVKRKKRDVRHR